MNSNPADPMEWSDAFLLGFAPMDNIHEEFVDLVNALRTCADEEVATALEALRAHTRAHFDEENRWMAETAFPPRDCHIQEHAAVLASIEGVRGRVERGDCDAARRLADALAEWFPGHADYLDSALVHWMCKLRLGGKPIVLRRQATARQTASIAHSR